MRRDDETWDGGEREEEKAPQPPSLFFPLTLPQLIFRSVLQFRCANGGGYMVTMIMW